MENKLRSMILCIYLPYTADEFIVNRVNTCETIHYAAAAKKTYLSMMMMMMMKLLFKCHKILVHYSTNWGH